MLRCAPAARPFAEIYQLRCQPLFVTPPFDVVAAALTFAQDRVALALRADAILFAEDL